MHNRAAYIHMSTTVNMKYLIAAPLILIFLPACRTDSQQYDQQSLAEASKQELIAALNERDQLLSLVKEISNNMERIEHLENILTVNDMQPREQSSQRTRILGEISSIQYTLRQRREQLTVLEAQLHKSSLINDDLTEIIKTLYRQIDAQCAEINRLRSNLSDAITLIDSLSDEIDSLNHTVISISQKKDLAESTLGSLETELNTCYYIAAQKSELRAKRIIETGFLRKAKLMRGDFDQNVFTVADKRILDRIDLNSRKINILTNHPVGSYEIIDSNTTKILHITDPKKFWSRSNYLVVQTD